MDHADQATRQRRPTSGTTIVIAAAIIVLDQLSKWWITNVVMQPPHVIPLGPFLNLTLVANPGVSFGMLRLNAAWGPWLLSLGAVAIVAWLFLWQRRAGDPWIAAGVGLISGGAVGNVIDRVARAAVTDFIDVYAGPYHWPAFNLADSAITVGVGVLLFDAVFRGRK